MSEQKVQPRLTQSRKHISDSSSNNDSDNSDSSEVMFNKGKDKDSDKKVKQKSVTVTINNDKDKDKDKRDSSDRSSSRRKRRSRSKETKKKNKSNQKSRYRSNSDSDRSRSNKRKRSKDRKKRDYDRERERGGDRDRQRERGRERDRYRPRLHRDFRDQHNNRNNYRPYHQQYNAPSESTEIPAQILMQMTSGGGGNGRRRQRSKSPREYYRRNQNNNDGQFWDAFSWVPRINYTPNVSTSALANTKKMRRLMITKIPYEIGITEENLRDLITRFMAQNYLKDQMNNCPVVHLQINQADHNVAVELSSVEETCRICRMDKIELFKGLSNGIIRLGDSIYGNSILTQAQTAGQAQAAAFAAINVLENKKTAFTLDAQTAVQSSTVIRVTNAVTPYMATHLTPEQWNDYKEDLIEGFSQYGKIVHDWFVSEAEKNICADPGNLFLEYEYKQNAEAAMAEMQGRLYDERTIKLFYWPRDLFYLNYRPGITPPVLPPPLKVTKPPTK